MSRILGRRPSPGTVIACIALFVSLGGVSYGVATGSINSREIKNNTIRSKDIRNNTVHTRDIRNRTIRGRDVRNNTLTGRQINESTLEGIITPPAPGQPAQPSEIPSGATIAGGFGGRYIAPQLAFNNSYLISSSFPLKAPQGLSDAQVNTAPGTPGATDPDPACTGSASNPTAPAGTVCLYLTRANNAQVAGFRLTNPGVPGTSPGDAYGFIVRILDTGTVGNTATTNAEGVWAYTAP
jgi:hypothetical protein